MLGKAHKYEVSVEWVGNRGRGTAEYTGYSRDHVISAGAKPLIHGSSDPGFRGDAARWSPEDFLVAALSACHKLFYLHLCADAGISVLAYKDTASGEMIEDSASGGHFTRVVLRPKITIREGDDLALAERLHHDAHAKCFIANSVNFPVSCEPVIAHRGNLT
jgi:organic hydroperoxide reductase OsmC/OhrA